MAVNIKVPPMGKETDAILGEWFFADGDVVSTGDKLVDAYYSGDETAHILSPATGTLKITKGEGDTVNVGDSIWYVDSY